MLVFPYHLRLTDLPIERASSLTFPDFPIGNIASPSEANEHSLIFIFTQKELQCFLDKQNAAFCLVSSELSQYFSLRSDSIYFIENARLLFAKVLRFLEKEVFGSPCLTRLDGVSKAEVPSSAQVDPTAQVDSTAQISPFCVIGAKTSIGKHVKIGPGVHVGAHCVIEDDVIIEGHTSIASRVQIRKKAYLGSHCVIGGRGFGYEKHSSGQWEAIPHLGGVVIEERVQIGSHVCVDAGVLNPTQIKNDAIIDNLVQIAHNVTIGQATAIAGCVGIAGSTRVGAHCLIGGGSCLAGHIQIADHVVITGMSMVTSSLLEAGTYSSGIPIAKSQLWRRNAASFSHLAQMRRDLSLLKKVKLSEEKNHEK